jgi:hypothetical protein
LVQDSDEVRNLFEEINPQLLEVLQIKLWPAGHLPFFQAKVEKAHRRIRRQIWMPRLIPLRAPKDLNFWGRSGKTSKRESEQPSGLSRTRKT